MLFKQLAKNKVLIQKTLQESELEKMAREADLVLPDEQKIKVKTNYATIIQIGTNDMNLQPNAVVVLSKYAGTEINIDNVIYQIINYDDILGEK